MNKNKKQMQLRYKDSSAQFYHGLPLTFFISFWDDQNNIRIELVPAILIYVIETMDD